MIYTINKHSWADELERLIHENMRIGTDFVILEAFEIPEKMKDAFRVEDYATVIFAEKGEAVFKVDMKDYHVKAPFMFVIMSGKIIHHQYISTDYSATILIAKNSFFLKLLVMPL
jgi:hypothetical protein